MTISQIPNALSRSGLQLDTNQFGAVLLFAFALVNGESAAEALPPIIAYYDSRRREEA